jgi:primary-amine oxidase
VLDIGEYGLGRMCNSLELGCDCLGSIRYMDAWVHAPDGTPKVIKNAICIHEEDTGVLWKHTGGGHTEVRRGRRLVVSCFATVGNYEYGSYYYFYMDGTFECEVKATGILSTGAVPGKEMLAERPDANNYGTTVAQGVFGAVHQHLFIARLDLAIDSLPGHEGNTVFECDTVVPDDNPFGNAWSVQKTPLSVECGRTRDQAVQVFTKCF